MPIIRSLGWSQRSDWATEEDPQSCSWLSSASPPRWKGNLWPHLSSCVRWIRFSSNISLDFAPFGVPPALTSAVQPWLGGPAPSGAFVPSPHCTHLLARFFSCDCSIFVSRPLWKESLLFQASSTSECWRPLWEPQYSSGSELWRQILISSHVVCTDMHFQLKLDSGVCSISWIYGSWTPVKVKNISNRIKSIIKAHELKSKCHSKRLKCFFQGNLTFLYEGNLQKKYFLQYWGWTDEGAFTFKAVTWPNVNKV